MHIFRKEGLGSPACQGCAGWQSSVCSWTTGRDGDTQNLTLPSLSHHGKARQWQFYLKVEQRVLLFFLQTHFDLP